VSVEAPSWLVSWLQTVSIWDAILWIVGLVGAVLFIRHKGWRWMIAFARAILATAEVIDHVRELPAFIDETRTFTTETKATLERQDELIESIHHETHTNNGSSIKDGVGRLEEGVEGLHGRLDEVERNVASLAKADVEIRAEMQITHGGSE